MPFDRTKWPQGKATRLTPTYAAVQSVDVWNNKTILDLSLTGSTTINLVVDPEIEIGAELLVKVTAAANAQDITFGTQIDAPNMVGVAGKTKTQSFIYTGSIFVPSGVAVQID